MSPRLRKALFTALTALVVVGGAELALRAAGTPPAYVRTDLVRWTPKSFMRDVQLPNTQAGVPFTVSTNGDALRTPHGRGEGLRIWLGGDSTVFGWGVDDTQTLPAALERALAGFPELRALQVVNGGQPSASTWMAARLARDLAPAYGVDLTVMFVPYHDDFPTMLSDREYLEGPLPPLRAFLGLRWRGFAALTRALRGGRSLGLTPRVPDADRAEALAALSPAPAVGLLPTPSTLGVPGETNRSAATEAAVRTLAEGEGWLFVDLRDVDAGVFPTDTAHFTAEGNAALAAALAEALRPRLGAMPEMLRGERPGHR